MQAFGGSASLNGPDTPPGADRSAGEMNRYLVHIDITTASMLVEAILQALIVRQRTGRGQKIELEMLGASLALQATRLAESLATGEAARPLGSGSATTAPHEAFRCADGVWLAVGVEHQRQWAALCTALGPAGAALAADGDGAVARDVAPAWRFSETPATIRRGAPRLGEHSDEVLAEAGYRPDAVAALRASGTIG